MITVRESRVIEKTLTKEEYVGHLVDKINQVLTQLEKIDIQDFSEYDSYFNDVVEGLNQVNKRVQGIHH